jgi:hypothetical protein
MDHRRCQYPYLGVGLGDEPATTITMQTEIIVFTGILCGSIGFFACALMASHTIRHYEEAMDQAIRDLKKASLVEKWNQGGKPPKPTLPPNYEN